jgi:hypothetical protein
MTMQHTTVPTLTYYHQLAEGLCTYATTHDMFAEWLTLTVVSQEWYAEESLTSPHTQISHHQYFVPRSDEEAIHRARWLIEVVLDQPTPDRPFITTPLQQFAQTRVHELPKAIVLGIEIGVLPIGLMGHMKIRREPMHVILRNTITETYRPGSLIAHITTLSHTIVERALVDAQGHTGRLEPELGDWLFGDKKLALFETTPSHLTTLTAHLALEQIPHAAHYDEHGPAIIIPTLSLYVPDLPHADLLTPYNTDTL